MPDPEAPKPVKQQVNLTLEEKDIKRIAKKIDDSVDKYIDELPKRIEAVMNKVVMGALGFKVDSWNNVEIDSYNRDTSFISKLISEKARKTCEEAMAKHEFVLGDEFNAAMRKEYAERLQRTFDNYFERRVGEHFDTLLKDVLNTTVLKLDLKVEVPKTAKDLANPAHLANIPKLRDLILKDVVENDAKKANKNE